MIAFDCSRVNGPVGPLNLGLAEYRPRSCSSARTLVMAPQQLSKKAIRARMPVRNSIVSIVLLIDEFGRSASFSNQPSSQRDVIPDGAELRYFGPVHLLIDSTLLKAKLLPPNRASACEYSTLAGPANAAATPSSKALSRE